MSKKRKPKTIIVIPEKEITPGDVIHAATQISRAIGAVRDAVDAAKPIIRHAMKRGRK